MLELSNLSFDYEEKPLLNQVSFTLEPGQLLHVKGANGSGKTTLLKLIAGLLVPEFGQIKYQNQPICHDLYTYQQQLAYVSHKSGINRLLTIKEHCHYDLRVDVSETPLEQLLQYFSLSDLENTLCGLLSAGQLRRVTLLRLIANPASIWLLDEPLVALDQASITRLTTLIEAHLAKKGLVILSSHQALPVPAHLIQEYVL